MPAPNTSLRATGKPGVYFAEVSGRRRFKVSFSDSDGKRRFKWLNVATLKEAVAARETLNVSIRRQEIVVSGTPPTFAQVRAEYVAARTLRTRTAEGRDGNLRLYCQSFEARRITEIGKAQVTVWLGQLRSAKTGGPLGEGSKAQVLAALSGVFEYAVSVGYIGRNPCREVKRPRQGEGRRRILTPDEETRLLAYCGRFEWLRPIVTTALYQALRLGEVAGLQWPDLDFEHGKVRVHSQLARDGNLYPTKGATANRRDPRDVHPIDLMPATAEALRELRDTDTGFVFRNSRGGPRGHRDISRAFEQAVALAGLPVTEDGPVTFHSLRHTGLSRLANHPQIPLVYVRDFAGHVSLSTTEGYVHRIESATATAAASEAMANG